MVAVRYGREILRLLLLLATYSHSSYGAAWNPTFTLEMETHDGEHGEASVPDACDSAKRPVQFFHNEPRHCFEPHRKLDIVIAFSREKLSELQDTIILLTAVPAFKNVQPCVIVGTKILNASEVLPLHRVDTVFELTPGGREFSVYFTYLVSYYGNLPEHVVVMHGRLNLNPEDLMPRFALFGSHTGLLGVINTGECSCTGCHMPAPARRIRELWSMFRRSFCPQNFMAFLNGHYVVSRKRILANPVDMYKVLYRYIMHSPGHFLAEDSHEQMKSAPNHSIDFVGHMGICENTLGVHVLERSWSFIFGCYQQPEKPACERTYAAISAAAVTGPAAEAAAANLLNPTCAYSNWQCYDSMPPWPLNTTHFMDGRPFAFART